MDAGAPTMERPPPSEIGQDKDLISALPDDILLEILECLDDPPEAVRAGAVSRRWRHLPHQLSCLDLDVIYFKRATLLEIMDEFTGAVCTLLSSCPTQVECKCDRGIRRAVEILRLCFYPSATHLGSIGRIVEDTVNRGDTETFEFEVFTHPDLIAPEQDDWCTELGQQFMSFSRTFPIAFRWLTRLSLTRLDFGESDLASLLVSCDKLKHLTLRSCSLVEQSVLKIDLPDSILTELELIRFSCTRIELVSLPKLTRLFCRSWPSENPPLLCGYVPELDIIHLSSHAKVWQSPFALTECFSMSTRKLSNLILSFDCQMIWIRPEHPKQLAAIFCNLTSVMLWLIFPDCDMSWTLFFLEAAPALKVFVLNRARHSCVKTDEDTAETTNVVWEPSKDLKHLNLYFLVIMGFEEEDKVENYIRLVMERAMRLKTIKLESHTCDMCHRADPESSKRSQAEDKASMHRIKERLTSGPSSSVEIIMN